MFELSKREYESLRRHFGTLKRGEHSKYLPYAFTEQGVAIPNVRDAERHMNIELGIKEGL